jgi:hypothetical protein
MTAQQIADATGLKVRTVHRRIQFGLPIEGPHRRGPQPRRFEFRGRLATVAEIMAATGLSRSQVSKRTDGVRFFERDEATDPNAPLHPSCRVLFLDGIADSVSGWSRRLGISREVITYRLKQGWSIRKTLTTPVKFKRKTILRRMVNGWRMAQSRYANQCSSAAISTTREAA